MPASKGDIRRKAMKKAVSEGYVKVKPGMKKDDKKMVKCLKCTSSFPMTTKGAEFISHFGSKIHSKEKSPVELFPTEVIQRYWPAYYKAQVAAEEKKRKAQEEKDRKAAEKEAKELVEAMAQLRATLTTCSKEGCKFLEHSSKTMGGFCCNACKSRDAHGKKCEKDVADECA